MDDAELSKRLHAIDTQLQAIEARLLPEGAAQQLASDALETYGLMGQVVEALTALRDVLHDVPEQLHALRTALAAHDAALERHDQIGVDERAEIQALMVGLRENSRKHVAGLADLERAIYGGLPPEKRRRVGEEERG